MKLFVGLGNPGAQYERNRHNVGFMAVERIASEHGFGPLRSDASRGWSPRHDRRASACCC